MRDTLILLAAASTMAMMGCGRSTKFSTVLDGGFDPVGEFCKRGYAVQAQARGAGVRNAQWGYGWESWCGILTRSNEPVNCESLAAVIRDELNRSMSGNSLDELTGRA